MLRAGWGRIVNVTTSLPTMQRKQNSPYGVSKVAIEAETLIWAQDLAGTGVTVNSLIPGGAADTDFVHMASRKELAAMEEHQRFVARKIARLAAVTLARPQAEKILKSKPYDDKLVGMLKRCKQAAWEKFRRAGAGDDKARRL